MQVVLDSNNDPFQNSPHHHNSQLNYSPTPLPISNPNFDLNFNSAPLPTETDGTPRPMSTPTTGPPIFIESSVLIGSTPISISPGINGSPPMNVSPPPINPPINVSPPINGSPPPITISPGILNSEKFLDDLGLSLYFEKFRSNDIDKMEDLVLVTESNLISMGITSIGHRNKIIDKINRIKIDFEFQKAQEKFISVPAFNKNETSGKKKNKTEDQR